MTDTSEELDFKAASEAAEDGQALIVDIEGYEGPLHLLLAMARTQKVDLLKLSILKLAEQYLLFVRDARSKRFSLAADYLVMAAWLAFLKSRLLLPKAEKAAPGELEPEEAAAQLAFRLARLDAIRKAADALKDRPQLKRDVFTRGDPQAQTVISTTRFESSVDAFSTLSSLILALMNSTARYAPVTTACVDAPVNQ